MPLRQRQPGRARLWIPATATLVLSWLVAALTNAGVPTAEEQFRAELVKGLGHGMPGISAAIATRQGVIWTGAVGYANIETRSRSNAAYLYGIGSITKTFVACVIQELADEGHLNLLPRREHMQARHASGAPCS